MPLPRIIGQGRGLFRSAAAALSYTAKAKAMGPIAYWSQADGSGTVMTDESGNGRHGAYGGSPTLNVPGIGDGRTAARYGTGKYGNLYSASLASAFSGQEVCFAGWFKASGAGVWTDGALRRFASLRVDGSNWLLPYRDAVNNRIVYSYLAGGTAKAVSLDGISTTDWFHVAMRISKNGDLFQALYNGCQTGNIQTALGTFAGSLSSTLTALCSGTGTAASNEWSGDAADAILFNSPKTTADVAILALCNGHGTFVGDSRLFSNAVPAAVMADAAVTARRFGYANAAISGQTMAQNIIDAPTRVVPLYRSELGVNWGVVWGIINDAAAGASAQTCYDRTVTVCNLLNAAGIRPIVCTEIDCQSVALNAVNYHSTIWPAYNALVNANWQTFAARRADLGANAALQNALNGTNYNGDFTHLTATGSGVAGGIIAAQAATL